MLHPTPNPCVWNFCEGVPRAALGIPRSLRTRPLTLREGAVNGVLCFSLGPRVRGNDG